MLLNILDPVANVSKRLFVGDVVHEQDSHGSAIVGGGNGAEALLASRVPNLQLDSLAVERDGANLKVDSNRGDEGRRKRVVRKAQQQT